MTRGRRLCWISHVFFLFLVSSVGASEFVMLTDYGHSAKSIALGNIHGSELSASALFENPAFLYGVSSFSASFFQTKFASGEHPLHSSAVAVRTDFGVFAFGFSELRINDLNYTVTNNQNEYRVDHTFSVKNGMYSAAYQFSLSSSLSLASVLNYYHHDLYKDTGKGINFDGGVVFHRKDAALALHVQNSFTPLKIYYANAAENFSTQITLAAQKQFSPFTFFGQIKMPGIGKPYLKSVGVHARFPFISAFSIQAGWKELYIVNAAHNTLSAGFSIELNPLHVHIAYERSEYREKDNQFYGSISLIF